jgi:glycosyltransferase involved in cell wall biosynthesis
LDHVLTALAQFPDEVILTVWCKSGDVIRFVQGVKSGPLSHRVRVFGEKDSEEAFFQSLDLFVQVFEEKEAIPVDFLKAMACEVPVIAARVRGVSGLIAEGETGLLFESGHSRELEIMIRKILSDSVLYRQIASQGANYVRQALDPEIRLDVLESMYHDLVE